MPLNLIQYCIFDAHNIIEYNSMAHDVIECDIIIQYWIEYDRMYRVQCNNILYDKHKKVEFVANTNSFRRPEGMTALFSD